jgi:hypothetical protein
LIVSSIIICPIYILFYIKRFKKIEFKLKINNIFPI